MDPIRFDRAQKIRSLGGLPYASTFPRTHKLAAARTAVDGTQVSIAGRIVLLRDMGKMTFATLQDVTGRLQIAFKAEDLGKALFRCFHGFDV